MAPALYSRWTTGGQGRRARINYDRLASVWPSPKANECGNKFFEKHEKFDGRSQNNGGQHKSTMISFKSFQFLNTILKLAS
jgi:hypothetical protein